MNAIRRLPAAMAAAALVLTSAAALAFHQDNGGSSTPKPPPAQPLPYSHKQHLALGLKCADCHRNADPGESMGFPATAKCMACHASIAKDKPSIAKLSDFAQSKRDIPWARVYQIPSYVSFSHRVHLEAGAKCEKCHGNVSQRDVMFQEGDISMGACMTCHREYKASNDCGYCHEPRQ